MCAAQKNDKKRKNVYQINSKDEKKYSGTNVPQNNRALEKCYLF
jgi:hypothetical protein